MKGTLTGLLYEETIPLASVVFCRVLKLFLRLLPEYRTRVKGKQTGLLRWKAVPVAFSLSIASDFISCSS